MRAKKKTPSRDTAKTILQRVEEGGDRLWRLEDFPSLPPAAVTKTLSRLSKSGHLQRLSKGVYHRSRDTAFGKSRPNPAVLAQLASSKSTLYPSGIAAANLLGLTTQVAARQEVATSAQSVRRKLLPPQTVIQTRRPHAWKGLEPVDVAILDVLRRRGNTSELSPIDTAARLKELLSQDGRMKRLLSVAATEPPRVRAMLGAIAEELGYATAATHAVQELKRSLNPLSKYDFGALSNLKYARHWQAMEPKKR